MFPRRAVIALLVASVLSPLSAVLAQESASSTAVDATTATPESSAIPTITSVLESASATATPVPTSSVAAGTDYFPPGQNYDEYDPNQLIDETAEENDAGADGKSDTFINIPLGAQIGIISVVVIFGISGLVASYLWYMRRRRQWETQGRRRSLVPRISVNPQGELTMTRPMIINKNHPAQTPTARPDSVGTVATFDQVDLEKGNQKSEFETEPKGASGWKKLFSKK